ncbi:MAG: hypothetical protein AAF967_12070 [Pseudomonadota bacterium]
MNEPPSRRLPRAVKSKLNKLRWSYWGYMTAHYGLGIVATAAASTGTAALAGVNDVLSAEPFVIAAAISSLILTVFGPGRYIPGYERAYKTLYLAAIKYESVMTEDDGRALRELEDALNRAFVDATFGPEVDRNRDTTGTRPK